jgi:hypothetical protein
LSRFPHIKDPRLALDYFEKKDPEITLCRDHLVGHCSGHSKGVCDLAHPCRKFNKPCGCSYKGTGHLKKYPHIHCTEFDDNVSTTNESGRTGDKASKHSDRKSRAGSSTASSKAPTVKTKISLSTVNESPTNFLKTQVKTSDLFELFLNTKLDEDVRKLSELHKSQLNNFNNDLVVFPDVTSYSVLYQLFTFDDETDTFYFTGSTSINFHKSAIIDLSKFVKVRTLGKFAVFTRRQKEKVVYYKGLFHTDFYSFIQNKLQGRKDMSTPDFNRELSKIITQCFYHHGVTTVWTPLLLSNSKDLLDNLVAKSTLTSTPVFARKIESRMKHTTGVLTEIMEWYDACSAKAKFFGKLGLVFNSVMAAIYKMFGIKGFSTIVKLARRIKVFGFRVLDALLYAATVFFLYHLIRIVEARKTVEITVGHTIVNSQVSDSITMNGKAILYDLQQPIEKIPSKPIKMILPGLCRPVNLHENTISNVFASVIGRQCKAKPPLDKVLTQKCFDYTKGELSLFPVTSIISKLEYIETRVHWDAVKKASAHLELKNLTHSQYGLVFKAKAKIFPKQEIINGNKDSLARLITMRGMAQNLLIADCFHSMQKRAKQQFSVDNMDYEKFVWSSGMTLPEIGCWFAKAKGMFNKPYYVGIDYSKFDSSQRKEHFEILEMLYKKALRQFPDKQKVMEAYCVTLKNAKLCTYTNYKEKSGFKVMIPVSRASGDPDTTYGNTLLNQLILKFVFHLVGITKYQTILGGDDSFSVVEEKDSRKLPEILELITKLGIKTTCEHSEFYGDVTYNCKMFVQIEGGFALIPLLGRVLVRAPLTSKHLNRAETKLLASVKCESISQELAIFKPIQAYYERCSLVYKSNMEVKQSFIKQHFKKKEKLYNDCRSFVPNSNTFDDVARRYRVTTPELSDFINSFNKRTTNVHKIDDYFVQFLLLFDNKELELGDELEFELSQQEFSGPIDLAAWQGQVDPGILYI